jgi:hypothetical protein
MTENPVTQNDELSNGDKILTSRDIKAFKKRDTWFINQLRLEEEKKYANEVLDQYLRNFKNLCLSQFEIIEDIVYKEVLKFRVQGHLNKWDPEGCDLSRARRLTFFENKIRALKKRLGIKNITLKLKNLLSALEKIS